MATSPKTQTVLISGYAVIGVTYTALVSPYNSFQKNFNMILTSIVKFSIFMVATLNGLVGRQSKDVAGAFSDFCGPLMIFCMFGMVGANIMLQV